MTVVLVPVSAHVPALVRSAGERAQTRFWEFFVNNIRNPHTRRAYGRAIGEFFTWCEGQCVASIAAHLREQRAAHARRDHLNQRRQIGHAESVDVEHIAALAIAVRPFADADRRSGDGRRYLRAFRAA